jgi:hypothetical protein
MKHVITTTWLHPESGNAYKVTAEIIGEKIRLIGIKMGSMFFRKWQFSEAEIELIEQAVREAAQKQTV